MTSSAAILAEPQIAAPTLARVLFFGRLADVFGRSISVAIPANGCSVTELRARIVADFVGGDAALSRPGIRIAIDQLMGGDDPWVSPGQEVAFLPAFSGG